MIITNVNTGTKAKYKVRGTEITVGEVVVDVAQRQTGVQRIIDICLDNQLETMSECVGAWYVATIVVPPIKTELVPTGEKDDDDNDILAERKLPVDMSEVELRLWSLPENYNQPKIENQPSEGVTE